MRTPKECCGSLGTFHKKVCQSEEASAQKLVRGRGPAKRTQDAQGEDALHKRIAELERRDEENQKKLEVLYSVADKSRLFNYENAHQGKKGSRVHIAVYDDKYLVGWRTMRDDQIHDAQTGRQVGETQQYEVLLLGSDGMTTKRVLNSYLEFSNLQYDKRVLCDVLSLKQDSKGELIYEVQLPDGRSVILSHALVNS